MLFCEIRYFQYKVNKARPPSCSAALQKYYACPNRRKSYFQVTVEGHDHLRCNGSFDNSHGQYLSKSARRLSSLAGFTRAIS